MDGDALLLALLVRGSAWLSFFVYITALVFSLKRKTPRTFCLAWSLAWLLFAIHVALAFHLVHHWSHAAAWEATRLQGGVGAGLYFNYAVLALWLFDILWCSLAPVHFLQRPGWIAALIHGFLLFMWFNATVIFAHNYTWLLGLAGWIFLFYTWYTRPTRLVQIPP